MADTLVRQKLTRDQVAIIVGTEDGQPQRIRAFEDLLASILTDPVEVVTSPVSGNTTYTISNVIGFQSILIREANLVASAGGPFTLTITTGVGDVVYVPIAAFGDTILSGDLLFDIYVDSSGNVISKDWEISGSNANGSYRLNMNGEASQRGTSSQSFATNVAVGAMFSGVSGDTPLPRPYVNTLFQVGASNTSGIVCVFTNTGITVSTFKFQTWYPTSVPATLRVYDFESWGRWRT